MLEKLWYKNMPLINRLLVFVSFFWNVHTVASDDIAPLSKTMTYPQHVTEALIKAKLIKIFGTAIQAEDIKLLGDGQVVETVLQDGSIVHFTPDAGYMIFNGELFSLNGSEIVNITESRQKPLRVTLLSQTPDEDLVIFRAKGEEVGSISVFTDIDCGYCRKLHNEVIELNNNGITVRYFSFPRAGVLDRYGSLTSSYSKLKSVWCSIDRNKAMDIAKSSGKVVNNTDCLVDIKKQFALGQSLGVSGTPAIILADGSLIAGYRPAKEIFKLIKKKI